MKRWSIFVTLVVASGCGRVQLPIGEARDVFPTGPYSSVAAEVPCSDRSESLLSAKSALLVRPPSPIPGDDGVPTTLSVVDQSVQLDVAGVQIDRDGEVLFVAVEPFDDLRTLSFVAGDAPRLHVRVLLKTVVRGGLFEKLTYCYEHYAFAAMPADRKDATIVLEDSPEQPARTGALVRFDPPMPLPESESQGGQKLLQTFARPSSDEPPLER